MARNKRDFEKSDMDSLKDANDKLKAQVKKLQREVSKLKSENKTLEQAWGKTEVYLKDVTKNKALSDIIKSVDAGEIYKSMDACPKCSGVVKSMKIGKFVIQTCTCGFRRKKNEIDSM
jgi:DNA repair exonuclease SbcCD ATPase subunit